MMPTSRPARRARHTNAGKSHPGVRALLVALVGLLAFTGAGAAFAYQSLQGGIDRHDVDAIMGKDRPERASSNPDDPYAGNEYNILVMGSDSREGKENQAIGGGDVAGMRSDTTLLVHISADRSRVDVVSIPRDLVLEEIPSCPLPNGGTTDARTAAMGWNDNNRMWNVPFALGGEGGDVAYAAACTIRSFENMTDVYVDDFVVVDMSGMEQMVDAIGGVPMCFEEDLYAPKAELDVSAGCHTLDGKTAVAFARARKGLGDGSDISRIGRQQELLMNMVEKVLDSNLLTDTADLYQFLKAATSSLTTSDDIGNLSTMVGMAYSLRGIDLEDVNFATLPFAWSGDRVKPNQASAALWDSIRSDKPMVLPEGAAEDPAQDDTAQDDPGLDDQPQDGSADPDSDTPSGEEAGTGATTGTSDAG